MSVASLDTGTKMPDESEVKKEGFILARSSRVQPPWCESQFKESSYLFTLCLEAERERQKDTDRDRETRTERDSWSAPSLFSLSPALSL